MQLIVCQRILSPLPDAFFRIHTICTSLQVREISLLFPQARLGGLTHLVGVKKELLQLRVDSWLYVLFV